MNFYSIIQSIMGFLGSCAAYFDEVRFKMTKWMVWFAPTVEVYPNNEIGRVMRCYMGRENSWLDSVSRKWVDLSLWQKTGYFIAALVCGGFAGMLYGSPILFMLSVSFLSLSTHVMLTSIVKNRFQSAKIFAEEFVALKKDIERVKEDCELKAELLRNAQDEFNQLNKSLASSSDSLMEKTLAFDAARQNMLESQKAIVDIIEGLKSKTKLVIEQKEDIGALFRLVCEVLKRCKDEVVDATSASNNKDNSLVQLTEVVTNSHDDIISFAEIVRQFGVFVEKNTITLQAQGASGINVSDASKLQEIEGRREYIASLRARTSRIKMLTMINHALEPLDDSSSSTSALSSEDLSDLDYGDESMLLDI